jgi:anaerobic magnesium-protoporphyrin IX monomethyl ester cyclase
MKNEILLIHPVYGEATQERIFQPGIEAPISLLYLASYLDSQGIDNRILDLRLEQNPVEKLRESILGLKPSIVGITASTAAIDNASHVAEQIKMINPEIVTVIGGWHASALPRETLEKYPSFDYVIHGEGEIALTKFIQGLSAGQPLDQCNGLAFRSNGDIHVNPREGLIDDLNSIPFPARDKVPIARYHPSPGTRNYRTLPSTGILVGRGCPYRCLFCYKGVWGKGIRFRSPENVLQEIEFCIETFGIRDFRFYDDTITFPRWDLESLCNEIINRKLNISWNCWSRVNDVDEDKLRMMKDAGCYHIKFGIEFGTEKALKLARKGATLEQARQAVALARKVGIECKGSFILGIPGENEADCRKTIDFAVDISPDFATFYPFDPIPGSPFYEKIIKGEINPEKDMLSKEKTQMLADHAYRVFYFRPVFILQRIKAFMRDPVREITMVMNGVTMITSFWLRKIRRFFYSL